MDDFFATLDNLYLEGNQQKIEGFLKSELEKLLNEGDERALDAASILNEMGGYYRGTSRYAESCDCCAKAIAILEEKGMGGSIQIATMKLNYAGTLRLMGRLGQSLTLFNEAKELLEKLGEDGGYEYISLLNNLSLTYQDMGDGSKAIELAEASLEAVRKLPNLEDEVPTALNNLAAMLLRQKKYDDAEFRVRQALTEFRKLPVTSAHEAAAQSTLGVILFNTGRTGEAADAFLAAATGTLAVFGKNVDYASALRSLSICREKLEDWEGADTALEEAVECMAALLGPNNPRVQVYAGELQKLRERRK